MDSLYLGLDAGTTAAKAIVCDADGNLLASGGVSYPLYPATGGVSEQDAQDWVRGIVTAVRQATRGIDTSRIQALSLSTQGGTTVPLDLKGEPLRRAMTWMDTRAREEERLFRETFGAEDIYRVTGWESAPCFDPAKLAWLRRHEPELIEKTAMVVTTLEYLNLFLTGSVITDPTNAAMRSLYDFRTGGWKDEYLEYLRLPKEKLPKLQPSGAFVGTLTQAAAELLGLCKAVKVYNGAHDQYCASLGCGATRPGELILSAGTTWVLFGVSEEPLYTASHIGVGRHVLPGLYGGIASLIGTGTSMEWLKNRFGLQFSSMDEEAAVRRERAEGLFFFPFLAGENFNRRGTGLSGGVYGLTLAHDAYDLARALMECTAFEVRAALPSFKADSLRMVGGAARSELWVQLVADAAGVPVYRPDATEACARGAALLAIAGDTGVPIRETAARAQRDVRITEPSSDYTEKAAAYEALLARLKD
ncbi:MAG: FGGY-family carbohydrate kinase [Clostridiaceae bacterium]|nr:FGGY-family carbohydrate kinase [Clostridiaceae bacterium]